MLKTVASLSESEDVSEHCSWFWKTHFGQADSLRNVANERMPTGEVELAVQRHGRLLPLAPLPPGAP